MSDLMEQQLAIESLMLDEAENRQRNELERATKRKETADTKSGRYYVKALAKALTPLLTAFINPEKKVGRGQIAAKLLKNTELEPQAIAYLSVKAILNVTHGAIPSIKRGGIKRAMLCRLIAERIQDEWRVRVFSSTKERKKLLKKLCADFDKRTYPREWRKRTIKNYFEAEQVCWSMWDERQMVAIGWAVLGLFRNATADQWGEGKPFLEAYDGGQRYALSDETLKHVGELHKFQASSFVLYRPMVVPPRPWAEDNLFRGGYISKRIRPYCIVKRSSKKDRERLNEMDWSKIIPALNALQETPWRVNAVMLEAVEWAYRELSVRDEFRKKGIGKLVSAEKLDLPEAPPGYGEDEEVTKAHNKVCFLIHSRNREDKSRRIAAEMALSMGKQYVDYEAIYMPHNMDSRGRAYPLPAVLNPQGPDYVKGLLEFSKGEPIENKEQSDWLAIAGANAYGNDKVSLEERVQWVHDNEEMIQSVAANYRSDLRWTKAGEPFCFLRFCLEWTAFKEHGYGYLSRMVCPVDATCSGLQHYAAMLRDEVGGKSVNLIPGLSRQDVYGDVASVVIQKLRSDIPSQAMDDAEAHGTPQALDWITFGIDRKVTKRQVMVVPYAGKFSSCLSYTKEIVAEKLFEGYVAPWNTDDGEDHHKRTVLLAQVIWEAIDEVVVKGKEAMRWLSSVASEFSKLANGTYVTDPYMRRMAWLTPDGFEVVHYREDTAPFEMQTYFDGRTIIVLHEGTGRLNGRDMSLAVAPNFVHALDANLMRETVMRGMAMGIHHFGMIHDSFGAHARFMPRFVRDCIKPAFVDMYTNHDVLTELYDEYKDIVEIDPPPSKGKLDINGVLTSEFFFS